ncbi:MAG: hypothetical protein ACK2U9_02550 [Anaerolineae bacterium]
MNPTLFATLSPVGFRAPEHMPSGIGQSRAALPAPRHRFLHDLPLPPLPAVRLDPGTDSRAAARAALTALRLPAVTNAVAALPEPATLLVDTAGGLREAGYEPDRRAIDTAALPGPWQVRAMVEVDDAGKAVRVFIEQGSGTAAVDGKVERALRRGHARPGAAAWGRVTVSLGGQP